VLGRSSFSAKKLIRQHFGEKVRLRIIFRLNLKSKIRHSHSFAGFAGTSSLQQFVIFLVRHLPGSPTPWFTILVVHQLPAPTKTPTTRNDQIHRRPNKIATSLHLLHTERLRSLPENNHLFL